MRAALASGQVGFAMCFDYKEFLYESKETMQKQMMIYHGVCLSGT